MTRARELADLLTGGQTISTADNTEQIILVSTDTDSASGPELKMYRNSASPADNDFTGIITFHGENDADEEIEYSRIRTRIVDATDGSEDSRIEFEGLKDGSSIAFCKMDSSNTVFNEDSQDIDFRVESNGNANMLFVDGGNNRVGIGTTSPGAELDIESTGPTVHRNDTDGVLEGAVTSRVLFKASGSTHGQVGFGTSGGNMQVTNSQGNLYLQADTGGSHSSSTIFFTVDNSTKARVISDGSLLVGRSSSGLTGTGCSFTANSNSFMGADNAAPLIMNRNNDDGTLMQFRQADNVEGSISVSGSTVSYNGGHLARFSQTTDGNRIDGLLKGTVMTNLDQMAVWSHAATEAVDAVIDADGNVITEAVEAKDAYTEDNEQLNCMAVSSVEGDINVAGVFVNWDDDDDEFTADMNVAMTGDMVIRIAQGTTVARGDLLMSAGDATAKPQDDDIVRSKTIAKVTSTNVSHTYDDGSYLVPCVLMAC